MILAYCLIQSSYSFGESSSAAIATPTPEPKIQLYGSYQTGEQVGFNTELNIKGLKSAIGQFLVISPAPVYKDPLFLRVQARGSTKLPEVKCSIDQSPFSVARPQDIHYEEFYALETLFMNTCLEADVTDLRGQIEAVEKQSFCEVQPLSTNSVVVKGEYCAFKIAENSEFKINYRLNSACLQENFLKEQGIKPLGLQADLYIYKTANLEDWHSGDLDIVHKDILLAIQPDVSAEVLDKGWPLTRGAQLEFGSFKLKSTPRTHMSLFNYLSYSFLINNNCNEVCKDGFCMNPCDYNVPIFSLMTLSKKGVDDTQFRSVNRWYDDGDNVTVPPQFLGQIKRGIQVGNFEKGDQFILKAEFANPALTLKLQFQIADIDTSGFAKFSNITYSRESKTLGNFEKNVESLPQVRCEGR